MKKVILSVVAGVAVLFSLASIAGHDITFGEVFDNLNWLVHPEEKRKEFWNSVKGKEVTWSGEVYDVEAGKSQVRILVADKSRRLFSGYNIRVITKDFSKASSLKKGQHIRFRAVLHDYHRKDVGAIVDLFEATVL